MPATLAFRVLGSTEGRRDLVSYGKASALYADADPVIHPEIPAYLSIFTFPPALRRHVETTGSTRDYNGPVGVPALRWDIDRKNDPDAALRDARRLAGHVGERYGDEGLSVYYSGSKGYHVESDTAGSVEPALDNHAIARRLAETIADEARVAIDTGVYDRVRLWRAPNSRHARSRLYKIRIELDDLPRATPEGVRRRAVEPIPYDPPAPPSASPRFLEDWRGAQRAVRDRADERRENVGRNGNAIARINPLTRLLIARPEDITFGERHRLLFSSAANLAEFATIDDLIVELLTRPGLDIGLPPRDVARQIRCGIDHARQREGGTA